MQRFSVRGGNELELQDYHKQSMPDEQITFGAYLDRRTDAQTKGHCRVLETSNQIEQ